MTFMFLWIEQMFRENTITDVIIFTAFLVQVITLHLLFFV